MEIRRDWITDDLRTLPNVAQWAGLRRIGMDERTGVSNGQESLENRDFINSMAPNAARFAHAVREHWGVENRLH